MEYKKQWDEIMALISQYDWAVEGMPQPEWSRVDRDTAIEIRGQLLGIANVIGEKL